MEADLGIDKDCWRATSAMGATVEDTLRNLTRRASADRQQGG